MQKDVQRAQWKRLHGSRVTGLQAYHVDVPSAANAKDISVVSYHAREGTGDDGQTLLSKADIAQGMKLLSSFKRG